MQAALNQLLLNGGVNAATFDSVSDAGLVAAAGDGISAISATTALTNGSYSISYVGTTTAGAGNETLALTLMDGTTQTLALGVAAVGGATHTFTNVGNGTLNVSFGNCPAPVY